MSKKSAIRIDFKDGARFVNDLKRMGKAVSGAQLLAALRAGEYVAIGHVKMNIVNWDLIMSGKLLNSVQEDDAYSNQDSAWVTFGPHAVYAAIHEFGGVITAHTTRGLIFQIEGQWIRTHSVTIPAKPYLRPVFDTNRDEIIEAFKTNLLIEVEQAFRGQL